MNYYSNYYFNKYASAQQGFTVPSSYLNAPNYEYLLKTAGMWDDIKQWGKDRAWDAMVWDIRNHPTHAANMVEQMRGKDPTSVGAWWDAFKGATKTSINNKLGIKEDNGGNKGIGGNSNDNWSKYLPLLGLVGGGALLGGGMGGWGGALMGGLGLPVAAWAIQQYMNNNKGGNSGSRWFSTDKVKKPEQQTQNQNPASPQQATAQTPQQQQGYANKYTPARQQAQQAYNQAMQGPAQRTNDGSLGELEHNGKPLVAPSNYLGGQNGSVELDSKTNNASGVRFTGDQMTGQQIKQQEAINDLRRKAMFENAQKYKEQLIKNKGNYTPEEYASKMQGLANRMSAFNARNVADKKELNTVKNEYNSAMKDAKKNFNPNPTPAK